MYEQLSFTHICTQNHNEVMLFIVRKYIFPKIYFQLNLHLINIQPYLYHGLHFVFAVVTTGERNIPELGRSYEIRGAME